MIRRQLRATFTFAWPWPSASWYRSNLYSWLQYVYSLNRIMYVLMLWCQGCCPLSSSFEIDRVDAMSSVNWCLFVLLGVSVERFVRWQEWWILNLCLILNLSKFQSSILVIVNVYIHYLKQIASRMLFLHILYLWGVMCQTLFALIGRGFKRHLTVWSWLWV